MWMISARRYWETEKTRRADARGGARVTRLELLKDTRLAHWRHEFLVLTLIYHDEERYLYLEHSWEADTPLGGRIPLAWGSQKGAADDVMFYRVGENEERERRKQTTSLIDVHFAAASDEPLTLRIVALLLRQLRKNTQYHAAVGGTLQPVTADQLKIYLMTEYGAWGGLLLRVASRLKEDNEYSITEYLVMRGLLSLYAVLNVGVRFRSILFGQLNWTIRLRTFSVLWDKTLDASDTDVTSTVLPPDLIELVPALHGSSISPLAHTFCRPGCYLYMLTPPIHASRLQITSVHIFLFGTVADEDREDAEQSHSDINPQTELSAPGRLSLNVRFRLKDPNARHAYAAVHVFDQDQPFVQALRHGDMIGIWTRGHRGHVHKPFLAMVKVVTIEAVDFLDVLLLIDSLVLLAKLGSRFSTDLRILDVAKDSWELLSALYLYLPWWLNRRCSGRLWAGISMTAKQLIGFATPLHLPLTAAEPTHILLTEFLDSLFSPALLEKNHAIYSAKVLSVELAVYDFDPGRHELLILRVLQGKEYFLHFNRPSDAVSNWVHCLSFIWNPHGLLHDDIKIYCSGEVEQADRGDARVITTVHFRQSDSTADSPTVVSVGEVLLKIKKDYWQCFWLNHEAWTWPFTFAKIFVEQFTAAVDRVEVDGEEEPMTWSQACEVLSKEYEGWRHAKMKKYRFGRVVGSISDIAFVLRQTRLRFLLLYWAVSPVVLSLCGGVWSSFRGYLPLGWMSDTAGVLTSRFHELATMAILFNIVLRLLLSHQ
ncbi:hypothetical protein A0H81_09603 [Grifola frondosa]|uniref:Uncharacterized protein n=1 Tax=Grifola frondosa TaxID=5627 RepID=A0A1C7M1M8_GRIFR|nr:hypothetical protein A0H81_09603 [Grifola frondosa]